MDTAQRLADTPPRYTLRYEGVLSRRDLDLFEFVDDPEEALRLLKEGVAFGAETVSPAFARSRTSRNAKGGA